MNASAGCKINSFVEKFPDLAINRQICLSFFDKSLPPAKIIFCVFLIGKAYIFSTPKFKSTGIFRERDFPPVSAPQSQVSTPLRLI